MAAEVAPEESDETANEAEPLDAIEVVETAEARAGAMRVINSAGSGVGVDEAEDAVKRGGVAG
jgi:hypothetical protein